MDTGDRGYTVAEVARRSGLTPQRVRQICAMKPETCSKSGGGWRLERDFVDRLVLEQSQKKTRREKRSGTAPAGRLCDLSDLIEATCRLAEVLEKQDSQQAELIIEFRQEFRDARESNTVLRAELSTTREELAELRKRMGKQQRETPAQEDGSAQRREAYEGESEVPPRMLGSGAPRLDKGRVRKRRRRETE